jgi:hypothetical protein
LYAALELDFNAGQHIPAAELCAQIIPNLDRTAVKQSLV